MMAAESGYAPAQFNVAYLCEQHMVSNLYKPPCYILLFGYRFIDD